jgi:hypothetical protein
MLPAHLRGRAIHFCGPEDDYDSEEDRTENKNTIQDLDNIDKEYDQM